MALSLQGEKISKLVYTLCFAEISYCYCCWTYIMRHVFLCNLSDQFMISHPSYRLEVAEFQAS